MSTLLQRGGRLGFATMALATILWAGTASTATAHGGGGGGGHGGGMGGGHMGGMGGGHMGGMGYGHMGGMGYGHMGGMGYGYGHHPGYGYGRYGYGGLGYGGYYPGFFGMGLYGLGFGGYGLGYGLGYGGYGLGYGGYGGYGYPYYGGLGYPYSTGYGYGYGGYPYYGYSGGYGYGYPAYSGGYTSALPLTTYSSAYVAPGGGTANTAMAGQPRILGVDEEPTALASGRKGMKIMNVYPGTAAQAAGLKAGDVLLSANGYLTEQHGNLAWIIANATPSNQLRLIVLTAADNQEHTVTAMIP